MGERGQIKMESSGVYLYTHWGGNELKTTLADALKRGRERWDDEEYLARIIFCEMIDDIFELTGFGIGTEKHGDLNYPLITVSCAQETVFIDDQSWEFETFIQEFKSQ